MKQTSRACNSIFDKYFQEKNFIKCSYEHRLYIKAQGGDNFIVSLYVYDLIFTGNNSTMFEEFKKELTKEFKMIEIRFMSYYLDIQVKQGDQES